MSVYDAKIAALDGSPDRLSEEKGKVTLMVNVASDTDLRNRTLARAPSRSSLIIRCGDFVDRQRCNPIAAPGCAQSR
jgi:hypothetical protein